MYEDFVEQSLKSSSTKSFHDPISKLKVKAFQKFDQEIKCNEGT